MSIPDTLDFSLQDVVNEIVLTGIDDPTFTGSGLNDMETGGDYTGSSIQDFHVRIYSEGMPDQFQYAIDGGGWSTPINITGSWQTLTQGVQVRFGQVTNHLQYDQWDFECTHRDSLIQCFDEAIDSYFDPSYGGSGYTGTGTGTDRLSNFRNYGWEGSLTHENVYKTGSNDYVDVIVGTGDFSGKVFCVSEDVDTGLIYYKRGAPPLNTYKLSYEDKHHTGTDKYYAICSDGVIIFVMSDEKIHCYYLDANDELAINYTYSHGLDAPGDIWYQNGYIWLVGADNSASAIIVYSVGTGGALTVQDSLYNIGANHILWRVCGDGTEYVYMSDSTYGVKSYHLSSGNITFVDGDDQGDNYRTPGTVDGDFLFTGVGTAVGPRSYTLSNGLFTYKSETDNNIDVFSVCGLLENSLLFVATNNSGLYCYRVNKNDGTMSYLDLDDQGGTYFEIDCVKGIVYVATSGGVRVYSYS